MNKAKHDALSSIDIRPAEPSDAHGMTTLLNKIIAKGGTTAHKEPFDEAKIMSTFIQTPSRICCFVAVYKHRIVGFQFLEWSDPHWPGEDRYPVDWGIISTFIDVDHQGKGIGRALFEKTLEAAQGCRWCSAIDATIRRYNVGGLAYYHKMGFVDYKSTTENVSKRYDLR